MSSSPHRKPYRSRSVPYMNLATSKDPNARELFRLMNEHPARSHIYLGPFWTTIYNEHKKSSLNLVVARKTATLAVLAVLNKIGETLNPFEFKPVTLEIYK